MDGSMDGSMDGWTDGSMNGWTGRQIDKQKVVFAYDSVSVYLHV